VLNGSSTASISGNTLTLTVQLTFQGLFVGNKTVYLAASDESSSTGLIAKGSWTVVLPASQPTVVAASPNNGTGAGQTFSFTFADAQNATNLTLVGVLFNNTAVGSANACALTYDRNAGTLSLLRDNALALDSRTLGSSQVLQNSQCS